MLRLIKHSLCAATLLLSFPAWSDTNPVPDAAELPLEDLRVFAQVYEHIRNHYVEEVEDTKLLEYAIMGMLSQLDPHSAYLNADDFEELQTHTSGEFGGLGIEVGMEDGFVKVISPIDDTPAARAGMEAGDLIIEIDGESVKGKSLNDAVNLMRGPKGEPIVLKVVRLGTDGPFDVEIVRDIIKVQSVRHSFLQPGFGYLRIAQFQVDTGAEVRKHLEQLKTEAAASDRALEGLVLDLRNNPGGVLQASVEVVDALLDSEETIVYTEGRMSHSELRFNAKPGDMLEGLPVVVLINSGSASASEIVSGALQDYGRAVIMGTPSFGKGSVQNVIQVSEKQAIKLTTAVYFTPKGRSIQAEGIDPDIRVERAEVKELKAQTITEAKLSGHLANANKAGDKAGKEDPATSNAEGLHERDNQLFEALSLLKGLAIYRQAQGLTAVETAAQ